jgi:tRNA(Ile)-lysidine synthase
MAGTGRLTPEQRLVHDAVAARIPAGPLVVALSGGADSAALAWAVGACGRIAEAVTIDHGLEVSAALVAAAAEVAAAVGMTHTVITVQPVSGSEADLRAARLAALEAAAPGATILTGHTADDQAETVLGNLLRGAGPAGLAGIPERRGRWLRPLLGVSRAATRAAAAAAGLPFVDDPTNADLSIRRNRLRNETIPALEAAYNPALRDALVRTAHFIAADEALLGARADRVPLRRDQEAVLIPAASLETLPGPVAARVVRRALRMLQGPYPGEAADVAAVLEALEPGARQLTGAALAEREGPWVAIHPLDTPAPPTQVDLPVPGSVTFGAWRIAAGSAEPGLGRLGAVVAGARLVVRAAVAGDRIRIAGGAKKVFDALAEAGVAPRLRPRWPVVEADGKIVWLVGVRAAPLPGEGGVGLTATRER